MRGLWLLFALLPAFAAACPAPSASLLLHSCWGPVHAELLLLPEDAPSLLGAPGLTVTAAYTGRDRRAGDRPNPVGLFIHRGQVVNPTLARMDGVLVLREGGVEIHHRARVMLDGRRYDLTRPDARRSFAEAAATMGASVLQSHLLVVDGQGDVRPRPDRPVHVRRLLFTDRHGFGIFQTDGAMTLYDAAAAVLALTPDMVLNLDMGSYDYCQRVDGGAVRNCGVLPVADTSRLSNVLRFRDL